MNATLRRWFRVGHIRDDEYRFWRYIVGQGYELGLGWRCGFSINGRRYKDRMAWNVALFFFTLHWSSKRSKPPKRKESKLFGDLQYGFYFLDGDLWLCWGDLHCITMPWRIQHYQTRYLTPELEWQPEPKHHHPGYTGVAKYSVETPFTYTTAHGHVQERVATLTFMQWYGRPRALRWTSLFEHCHTSIRLEFNEGVGVGVDSWKGGILGTTMSWDGKTDPIEAFQKHLTTCKW